MMLKMFRFVFSNVVIFVRMIDNLILYNFVINFFFTTGRVGYESYYDVVFALHFMQAPCRS